MNSMSDYAMQAIAATVNNRNKAIEEWDEEEKKEKSPAKKDVVFSEATNKRADWKDGDQEFIKKLIAISIKEAEESEAKGQEFFKDVFTRQAIVLYEELQKLEKTLGKGKKTCKSSNLQNKTTKIQKDFSLESKPSQKKSKKTAKNLDKGIPTKYTSRKKMRRK